MREAFPTPLVIHSHSPSHTSSPRPPQINVPLSLPPNPPLPLSMALLNLPILPPLPSLLPIPLHSSPVPSSFLVSFSLSLPSSPFLTLPFPPSGYPCDLAQPFRLSLKRQVQQEDSSGRGRGWEEWEGERQRDKEHEGSSRKRCQKYGRRQSLVRCWRPPAVALKNGGIRQIFSTSTAE